MCVCILGNEANNNDVNDELNEIRQKHQEKIDKSKHQSWAWILKRIFSNAFLKPFSCVGSLYLITTWHGFNCIMVYMISVLNDTGSSFDIRLLETLGEYTNQSTYQSWAWILKRIFPMLFFNKTAKFLPLLHIMALRVMEFLSGKYEIRKIFA